MTANKKTILLVDDEEAARRQIGQILRNHGYDVLTAKDYDEALATHRQHRGKIDLLLTDVSLPALSGCDLAIASREEDPEMQVLLMSASSGAEVLQFYGVPLTDAHFLQKPFQPADLLQRVTSLLDRSIGIQPGQLKRK
jgi:two-component system, cell cycle sensor histidine kinase and response regulator CckA